MKQVKDEFLKSLPETETEKRAAVPGIYEGLREKIMREEILGNKRRPDGRKFDEIRNISGEVGVLPRTHGSALFTRGETQALVTVTLGTSEDTQSIDTVQEAHYEKRFMLHYNFPPFSVGEVKFLRGPGRREIGHGALAERALRDMLPPEEVFPYTIRIVSDILESNGSSSMASICGGTLALMDAGVPLQEPGGRRRHGPRQGGRQATRSCPTSPASRTTTATWTSRSPAPRRASRRCRWTSRSAASRRRSWPRRWSRPAWAACTSWSAWPSRWRSRARTSAPSRRASSR